MDLFSRYFGRDGCDLESPLGEEEFSLLETIIPVRNGNDF